MNLSGFYNVIITLFILLAVGFMAMKLKVVSESSLKFFSKLIIQVAQPCMIVNAFIKYSYSAENLKKGLTTLAIGFGLHIFQAIFAFIAVRIFPYKDLDEKKLSEFSIVFGNCGFLGFPLMESLFGPEGLFLAAFFNISFHITLWTWGIAILSKKRPDIKLTPKKIFINFGTIPCIVGIGVYLLSSVYVLPESVSSAVSYLSSLCTPISVLVTGALLATKSLKNIISPKIFYSASIKQICIPLLIALIMHILGFDDNTVIFFTIMSAVPSAATVSMLGEMYSISPAFGSQLVGTSTLMSIGTMPLVLFISNFILKI